MSGVLRISGTRCMGHGRCYTVAPDLVHDDEEGYVVERGTDVDVPDDRVDQAVAAADACPEAAIEYLDARALLAGPA